MEERRLLSAIPSVTSLTLVNAASDNDIGQLTNGETIDTTRVGTALSVRANTSAADVGSVVFKLDGKVIQVESFRTYAIRGNTGDDYNPWTPSAGTHTLTATAYTGHGGTGRLGGGATVTFKVVNSGAFPTHLAWKTGASSPVVRAEAVGAAVGGKLYVFGGFNNDGSETTHIPLQSRSDTYDPTSNTWQRLRDFPEPFTHSEGVVVGTDIWFVGGYLGDHPGPGTTHVWVYHTSDDTWTRGPDLPVSRGAGAAALVGRTLYFTGGMNESRTIDENHSYALDLDDQSAGWVQKADLPNGRNHVAAASLGGYLYVIGGQHGQEDEQVAQSEVDRYDPATDTWTKVASLPTNAGKSHISTGTLAYNGRLIVIGGETGHDVPHREIMDYDPTTNTWAVLGLLPSARSTVVAGFINGKLVITTGNGPAATNSTWVGTLS